MYLYTDSARFDPRTGKPTRPVLVRSHQMFICDYTGELIDTGEDYEETPLYSISIDYNEDSEPLWYQDAHDFENDYGITYGDFAQFMGSPIHFKNIEGFGVSDASVKLIAEWVKGKQKKSSKDNPWFKCNTLEQALAVARLRTLRKLLDSKKYTFEKLGFSETQKEIE